LLEFALTELWKRRREGMLTHEAYRGIEGVTGALTQWANTAFYALELGKRRLAQRIFTDLVYIGDTDQGILDSRRRRTLTSLCRNEHEQESIQRAVQHLVENRLLVTDRDLQTNEETVEIIHDVLLREWGQLKTWLEEDHRFLIWHQSLERLVRDWTIQRDKNKLLKGRDLTEAEGWLKERGSDLNQDEIALLHASAAHRIRSVVSIIAIILLLVSTTGVAGWYTLHQPPDPTHVTTLQDNVVGSLRWAIDNAPFGSTITFDDRLQGQTILLTADLLIPAKHFVVRGPGRGSLTVNNKTNGIIISARAFVNIYNLTFTGGLSSQSSLFKNDGTLTFMNSTIKITKPVAPVVASGIPEAALPS